MSCSEVYTNNETESIRSESRTEESLKDVHIDATIQTLDTSYTPSVSVETQHTEPKRKRKKPLSSPRSDDPIERAKLRRIRLRLRDATLGTDIDELDEAIWLFETYELVDNGDLTNAVDRLDFLQLRQDLREALVRRNLGILRRVIEDSRASKHEQELGSLLTRAEELRDHLQALDSYSHDILSMDQKLISEIRSYCSPPPSVHEVMAACYMLLGVREERLLEWAEIQSQLGRLGRNGLRNMILNFDPDSVPLEMVLRIKEILNFYRLEDVRIASNGAASFYIWAKNMVDMIDRRRAQSNENDNKERVKSAEKQG
ncbi:uncharacterized protein LOC135473673 [Liolophura sinensis]|uniref:uncharacterized protein LOC135473673 n=1 Tax=Liolophura sinensis TaxID=3198878 RepID=UPI0031588D7E